MEYLNFDVADIPFPEETLGSTTTDSKFFDGHHSLRKSDMTMSTLIPVILIVVVIVAVAVVLLNRTLKSKKAV